ncbi:MAG: 30S ribosomal protein S7 [Elusimicrobiota bacterium]
MSRRQRKIKKREVFADYKYDSLLIARFIVTLMREGKRSIAERILYQTMDSLKEKTKQEPLEVITKAVENVRPLLEVKPRRVGGATYQVPIEVNPARGTILAIRWLSMFAKQRKGKPMHERLTQEILEASRREGSAMKKKEDTHKMAESNKAFAHYRW